MAQPKPQSRVPVAKVQAAGIGGALATVIIAVLEAFDVSIPPEVAAAAATILAFAAGYLRPAE